MTNRLNFAVIALAGLSAISANADVITYNATLASPDTNNPTVDNHNPYPAGNNPSWYNGSGNPQGGFTVVTPDDGSIELGLRAKIRGGAEIDSATDVYVVPQGGAGPHNYAIWNYEFSIDLRPNGVGSLTLNDITATLTVSDGTNTASFDPRTYFPDSTGFGTPGGLTGNDRNVALSNLATDYSVQNSENPAFFGFPIPFDTNNQASQYEFTLSVTNVHTGDVIATDEIDVQVAPEPSTFVLLFAAAGALFFFRRRQSASV